MKRLSSLFAVVALLVGVLLVAGVAPAVAQEGGEPTPPPAVEEPVPGEATGITEGEGPSAAEVENIQPIQFALRLTGMRIAQRANTPEPETPPTPSTAAPATPPAESAPATRDGISPEVMAAISAAVAVATQKRFRIKRIRYREAPPLDAWSRQGRIMIMTSRRGKQQK
jgi:hypothetical protein